MGTDFFVYIDQGRSSHPRLLPLSFYTQLLLIFFIKAR
jgi:hypothetical protein